MSLKSITDIINKNLPKKYTDFGKFSNLVIDHSMLEGKIKEISLDFIPKNEKITYDGYEMIEPGILEVNIVLNIDETCGIDDDPSDCLDYAGNYIGLDPWQFINNVIFPYVSKKYLNLMGFSFKDVPYVDFVVKNSQGQTLFYYDEDLDTFIGSKNPTIWKKVD